MLIFYFTVLFSHEGQLSQEEFARFLPVCRTMNLPIQSPVTVSFSKKMCITEEPTGRVIEFKSRTSESNITVNYRDCTFVSFNSVFECIEKLFVYRKLQFAIITKFDCAVNISNGLVNISDTTINSQTVCQLKEVSRPLIVAVECSPQLWILNAHV